MRVQGMIMDSHFLCASIWFRFFGSLICPALRSEFGGCPFSLPEAAGRPCASRTRNCGPHCMLAQPQDHHLPHTDKYQRSLPGTGTAYTRPRVAYQVHMYHDMVKYGGPSRGCPRGGLLAWQNEYDWYWFHLDTVENKIRDLIHTRPRSTDSSATRPCHRVSSDTSTPRIRYAVSDPEPPGTRGEFYLALYHIMIRILRVSILNDCDWE